MTDNAKRCIRCGGDAFESLYCAECFQMEWNRSVMAVDAKPVEARWVQRVREGRGVAKEFRF